jgi:ADP-ribose pyrophosphatase
MTFETNNSFTQNDYEIEKREVLFQGFLRLVRYHLKFKLFKGGFSPTVIRELVERQAAVGVLPYDPISGHVVLIEQFRPGALSNPESPWLLEIIAGVFRPNESPKDVIYREAIEEAGCELLDLYPICEYFVSPGAANEYIHLFCGRIDSKCAGGIHGLLEENEDIKSIVLPLEEALLLLQKGKIKTAPAIISLQWLLLNHEWLKQLWQTK